MDIYDDHSLSPSQNHCGSSPPWNDEEIDASFANQSMEVNPPTSSAHARPMPMSPTPPAPSASQPKGPAETPKINSLKRKHPLEMLKDINEAIQRVKVETVEIQAKSKLEREKLQIADARERREHERFMADRQLEMLHLQAMVAGTGGAIPELPK